MCKTSKFGDVLLPMFAGIKNAELHFLIACNTRYGHCTYLRLVDRKNKVHVTLLVSKANVCSIRAIPIPRIELQAAWDTATITTRYIEELDISNVTAHYYTE